MRPLFALPLAVAALAACLAPPTSATPETCNNDGIVVQVGVSNEYHCTASTQYCHQGSGAGAGAGAGSGAGNNDAGAEASAGTSCTQSTSGDSGACAGQEMATTGFAAANATTAPRQEKRGPRDFKQPDLGQWSCSGTLAQRPSEAVGELFEA